MVKPSGSRRPDGRIDGVFRLVAVAVTAFGLGSCGGHVPWHHPPHATEPPGLVFSPNGEPLSGGPLGHPACEAALGGWMDRVDSNRDGVVERGEFLADAETQFARMDLDHDGFVTAAELSTYCFPYLAGEPAETEPGPAAAGDGRPANGARHRASRAVAHALPPDISDPVMSADTDLDFRVSRDEFLAQAGETFAKLDTARDGRVTRDAVLKTCPPREH